MFAVHGDARYSGGTLELMNRPVIFVLDRRLIIMPRESAYASPPSETVADYLDC